MWHTSVSRSWPARTTIHWAVGRPDLLRVMVIVEIVEIVNPMVWLVRAKTALRGRRQGYPDLRPTVVVAVVVAPRAVCT